MAAYQPVSRFWAFRGTEACIVMELSGVPIALACQLVLSRDA